MDRLPPLGSSSLPTYDAFVVADTAAAAAASSGPDTDTDTAAAAFAGPDTGTAVNPIPLAIPDQSVTLFANPTQLSTLLNANWEQKSSLPLSGDHTNKSLCLENLFVVSNETLVLSPYAHSFIEGGSIVCPSINLVVVFNPNLAKAGGAGLDLACNLLKKQLGCSEQIVWDGILECYKRLADLEKYSSLSEYQFACELAMRCFLLVSIDKSIDKSEVESKKDYSSDMIADDLGNMGGLFDVDSANVSKNLSFTVFNLHTKTPAQITFCTTPAGKKVPIDSRDALAVRFSPNQQPTIVTLPVCFELDSREYDWMLKAKEFALAKEWNIGALLKQSDDRYFELLVHVVNNLNAGWMPKDPTTTSISFFLVLVLRYSRQYAAAEKKPSLGEYLVASMNGLVSPSADRFYDNLFLFFAWLQNVNTLDYESRQNLFRALPDQNDVLESWIQCLGGDLTQRHEVQGVLLKEYFIDILLEKSFELRRDELFKEVVRMIPPKKNLLDWVDQHLLHLFQKVRGGTNPQQTQLGSADFRSFCEAFGQDRLTHRFAEQLFEEFVAEGKEESVARFCDQFESLYPPSAETKKNSTCTRFIVLYEQIQSKGLSENLGKRIFATIGEFMRRYPLFNTHIYCLGFLFRLPHFSFSPEKLSFLMIELLAVLFPQESTELASPPKELVETWKNLLNSLKGGREFAPLVDNLFATAKQTTAKSSGNSKQPSSSSQEKHLLHKIRNQARALSTIFEKEIPIDEMRAMELLLPSRYFLLKEVSRSSNFFTRIAALLLKKQNLSSNEFSFLVDFYKNTKGFIKDDNLADFLLQVSKSSERDPLFEELLGLFIFPIIQQVESHPLEKQIPSILIAAITSRRKLMEALSKEKSFNSSTPLFVSWRLLLIVEELSQPSPSEKELQITTPIDFSLLLAYKVLALVMFYERTKSIPIFSAEIKKQFPSNPPLKIELAPAEKVLLSHAALMKGENLLPWLRYQTAFSCKNELVFVTALNEMFTKVYGIVDSSTDAPDLLVALEWLERVATPNLLFLNSSDLIACCIYNLFCQKTTLLQQFQQKSLDLAHSMADSFQKGRNWKKGIAVLLRGLSGKPKEMSAKKISALIATLEKFKELDSDVIILVEILNLICSLFKEEEENPRGIEEWNRSLSRLQVYASTLYQACLKKKSDQGKTLGDYYLLFKERNLPQLITSLINLAVNPAPDSTKKMQKLEKQFVCLFAELFSSYYLSVPKKDFAACKDSSFWRDFQLFICYTSDHFSTNNVNWLRAIRATLQCALFAVDKAMGEKGGKTSPSPFMNMFTRECVEKICRLVRFQGEALREKTTELRQAFSSHEDLEKLNSSSADLDAFFRQHCDSIHTLLKLYLDVLHLTNVDRPQEDAIVRTICNEFQRMPDVDALSILFKMSLAERSRKESNNGQINKEDLVSGWPLGIMLSRFSQILGNEESMRLSWNYINTLEALLGNKKCSLHQYQTIPPLIATILTNSLQGPLPNTAPLLSWLTDRFERKKAKDGFELTFQDHIMMCVNITTHFEFSPSNLHAGSAVSRKEGEKFLSQHVEDLGKKLFTYCSSKKCAEKRDLEFAMDTLFVQVGWMESSILLSAFIRGLFKSCLDALELEPNEPIWAIHCARLAVSAARAQIAQLTKAYNNPIFVTVMAQHKSSLEEMLLLAQTSSSSFRVSFVSILLEAHQAVLLEERDRRPFAVNCFLFKIESDLIDTIVSEDESDPETPPLFQNLQDKDREAFRRLREKITPFLS
ncbi:hypothetical protein JYU14_01020 [Simkania negevensis]|uniref:Uncharacterized protein n=1 Tax=Simkania negevensis TaxID=83561 RepID=A0ABS3APN2_9BACT|nr:hypothetical protein [Simkania negevensis]